MLMEDKKSKLKKLKMPSAGAEEMDMSEMEMPEEEMDMEEEMPSEEMEMEEAPSVAQDLSDDELLAEIKKRGLMSQLEDGQAMEDDQEQYS